MIQQNHFTAKPVNRTLLTKRMLLGAAIGLAVILFFIIGAGEPNPEWGKFWMIKPLILVPLAGATAGLCNYFITHLLGQRKILATMLSIFVYLFGLWIGVVLGLNGTMWN